MSSTQRSATQFWIQPLTGISTVTTHLGYFRYNLPNTLVMSGNELHQMEDDVSPDADMVIAKTLDIAMLPT